METKILQAKDLNKTFIQAEKSLKVLNGITQNFEKGKAYAITGASGSGKSTLLHILGGLDTPTSGTVLYNNQNVTNLRAQKFGFVFQFHYLINELTVLENLMVMGLIAGKSKPSAIKKATELLKHVGLESKAHAFPFELSGGEQQRVSILRAICNKPEFLLADEPTGNLDAGNAKLILDFLLQCKNEWGMGIIICSHDKNIYSHMEQIFELKNGILR
jgi:ABC-type lipoprotein export system ATPase subunit